MTGNIMIGCGVGEGHWGWWRTQPCLCMGPRGFRGWPVGPSLGL